MAEMPLLELTNVSKINGSRLLFKNLNLRLRAEEGVLLTGNNGAGKSTLLKIIAGLTRPASGSVTRMDGLRMSYLGHATFIYPGLTAFENLSFWHKASWPELEADLEKTLDSVGLLPYAHESAGKFSRGMAQRLNFARVLLANPQLLLLDEPFTGIDAQSRQLIVDELKRKRKNGTALLIVSHDRNADRVLVDKEYMLDKKRLKLMADPSEEGELHKTGM